VATDQVIGPTIQHLRTYCAPFAGNVAGAADFRQGLENYNTSMKLPAAYVVPLDQEAPLNRDTPDYFQIVHKTIAVIVELDATSDRRGQVPIQSAYDTIEAALFSTLIKWEPASCRTPSKMGYQFAGARVLDLDRARLFYQWEFLLPWQLTDEDGWHNPTPPIDLLGIELDVYKQPTELPLPPADGTPPAPVVVIPMSDQPIPPDLLPPLDEGEDAL
jgi:hypothetical protein